MASELLKVAHAVVSNSENVLINGASGHTYTILSVIMCETAGAAETIDMYIDNDGGGTDFDPPFYLVEREGFEVDAFIYFTDGYAYVGEKVCNLVDYPVLWATTGATPSFMGEAFGEIIEVAV